MRVLQPLALKYNCNCKYNCKHNFKKHPQIQVYKTSANTSVNTTETTSANTSVNTTETTSVNTTVTTTANTAAPAFTTIRQRNL